MRGFLSLPSTSPTHTLHPVWASLNGSITSFQVNIVFVVTAASNISIEGKTKQRKVLNISLCTPVYVNVTPGINNSDSSSWKSNVKVAVKYSSRGRKRLWLRKVICCSSPTHPVLLASKGIDKGIRSLYVCFCVVRGIKVLISREPRCIYSPSNPSLARPATKWIRDGISRPRPSLFARTDSGRSSVVPPPPYASPIFATSIQGSMTIF